MRWHLYGIVRAGISLPARDGVGDPPGTLKLVALDDIAAVVSELDERHELTDDDAVTHLEVLSSLVLVSPVLPLRFGTEAPDDKAVREEVLAPEADRWRHQLDALDGVAEVHLDLIFNEEDALREVMAAHPEIRELAGQARGAGLDGQISLGEAVADALMSWCQQRGDELVGPLAGSVARAHRLPQPEPHIDRWALLVRVDELPTLDEKVSELRNRKTGARVDYVGPMPAVSFLEQPGLAETPTSRWGW